MMMTIDKFITLFADLFDNTDPSVFCRETKFHDLDEWSSLIGLSVIALVDEEFDVSLNGDDIRNAVTINDLYEIIIKKQ